MTWADAMGLVVIEGLIILVLVLTGFRTAVFTAVPRPLKIAISVGIGLFIALIGLVDAGVVRSTAVPVPPIEMGIDGQLAGWPVFLFAVVLLALIVMYVLKVKGAILWAILGGTVLAILVEAAFDIGPAFGADGSVNPKGWGLNVPALPDQVVDTPDFGLLGEFSLLGSWEAVGVLTAALFVFTLLLADFFDTMGTMVAVGAEGDLLDEEGNPPNVQRILIVDS
ncbi:MAG: solute carrier family 23 protein, partial [Pseudonocardiaceae bacterium]